jgi:hypothetical protein
VSFTEHILWQELQSGKMCFASWDDFTEEFALTFCPENEATTALMGLESDQYYQGRWNVEAYIDEFKDLVNLSRYKPHRNCAQIPPRVEPDDAGQNHQV